MKSKILYILSTMVLISAFLLVLSGFVILFYPFNPVTFNTDPFIIDKVVYEPGDMLYYELDFTKHMDIKPRIEYFLTDGVVYPLSKIGLSRPVGKQVRKLSLQIPEGLPPGRYRVQIDFDYPIYFRHIFRTWQSEEFYVTKKEVK